MLPRHDGSGRLWHTAPMAFPGTASSTPGEPSAYALPAIITSFSVGSSSVRAYSLTSREESISIGIDGQRKRRPRDPLEFFQPFRIFPEPSCFTSRRFVNSCRSFRKFSGDTLDTFSTRSTLHQHHPHTLHGCGPEGKIRTPRLADGRRPDGLCPLDPLPET